MRLLGRLEAKLVRAAGTVFFAISEVEQGTILVASDGRLVVTTDAAFDGLYVFGEPGNFAVLDGAADHPLEPDADLETRPKRLALPVENSQSLLQPLGTHPDRLLLERIRGNLLDLDVPIPDLAGVLLKPDAAGRPLRPREHVRLF